MRLVSYVNATLDSAALEGAKPRVGALIGRNVVDLAAAWEQAPKARGVLELAAPPRDVRDLLWAGNDALLHALEAATWASENAKQAEGAVKPRSSVTLRPPVRPGKIICVGLNYLDHIREVGREIPKAPTLFAKPPSSIIGPGDSIVKPSSTDELDHEVELAVIIGRRVRHVERAEARNAVAGYTVLNDVSARDMQRLTTQWFTGKALDTSCPIGPALVTADDLPDPTNLDIQCSVNGEVRQRSNTKNLLFGVDALVSYISGIMTLEPGDIIATGTPGGVALGQADPHWLKAGDTVRCEISGIGVLENSVVTAAGSLRATT